jgi:phosphoenolpyruvate carboxylase
MMHAENQDWQEARLPASPEIPLNDLLRFELEIKGQVNGRSASAELESLLDEIMGELRAQADLFRKIRIDAQEKIEATGVLDETELKLAKLDIKAATEAISLITRTLEKIDSLRRSVAEDQARAAEENFDEETYRKLLASIESTIENRARDLADLTSGKT